MLLSLRKLTIQGFRGVRNRVSIDFTNTPPGLYFIRGVNYASNQLGSNGSGKSSITSESIIWALTNRTSSSQRPGSDVENRFTDDTTLVSLEVGIDQNIYTIERTRRPNSLKLDGRIVEQQEIFETIPLSEAALRKSLLIGQFGEMFLSLRPEAQSQLFTETLDLDKWLRAADIAGAKQDKIQQQIETTIRQYSGCERALKEVRDQLELSLRGEKEFEEEVKGKLRIAEQKFDETMVLAHEMSTALDDARKLNASGDVENVQELNAKRQSVKRLQTTYREAETRVKLVDRELEQLIKSLANYQEDVEYCPECGQAVNKDHILKKRKDLLDKKAHIEKLAKEYHAQLEVVEKELKKAETGIDKLEELLIEDTKAQAIVSIAANKALEADREAARAKKVYDEVKASINPFTKQCDALEARVKKLRAEIKLFKQQEVEYQGELAIYKFWSKGFREIRLQQMDEVLAELEIATCRHAEALGLDDWRIVFATNRENKKGNVSIGFNVQLYPPGSDEPVNLGAYCGGEVQRWQLAASFGLSTVLLGRAGIFPDFEVLDEPTKGLSPEGINDLLEYLSDRAAELQRRIFLIDQHAINLGALDGVITIANTEDRGSHIQDTGGVVQLVSAKKERVLV